MLVLRFIDPSLDQDLLVIINHVNQLPSWEALHLFLSVLPNWDDLHACHVNQKYSTCMHIVKHKQLVKEIILYCEPKCSLILY